MSTLWSLESYITLQYSRVPQSGRSMGAVPPSTPRVIQVPHSTAEYSRDPTCACDSHHGSFVMASSRGTIGSTSDGRSRPTNLRIATDADLRGCGRVRASVCCVCGTDGGAQSARACYMA
jgi:hypothetical protein